MINALAESSVMTALYDWAVPMFAVGATGLLCCIFCGLWLAMRDD